MSNLHEMSGGQLEGKVLFALLPDAHLFGRNLLQFLFSRHDLLHNKKQCGLLGMLHAFAKAKHCIESKTECHI